jgi:nicotinamidase/pyrazinamidase
MTGLDRRRFLGAAALLAVGGGAGIARAAGAISPGKRDVLLVIDMQHCAVYRRDAMALRINRIARSFRHVVLIQDRQAPGADVAPELTIPRAELVLRSHAAFDPADRTPSGLAGYLQQRGLERVFLAGLATGFGIHASAVAARRAGFESWLIEDACRGSAAAWQDMAEAGVQRIRSADLLV